MAFSATSGGTGTARNSATAAGFPAPSSGAGPAFQPGNDDPRESILDLGAFPSAVPCARLHARKVLCEWGMKVIASTVEIVVSELVTNAVRASQGHDHAGVPPVRLRLIAGRRAVRISVWDCDARMPKPQNVDPAAESGRGLLLVDALCDGWGSYPVRQGAKVVWAILQDLSQPMQRSAASDESGEV